MLRRGRAVGRAVPVLKTSPEAGASPPFDWVERLTEETGLLSEMASLARASRSAAVVPGDDGLSKLLHRQAEICGRLETLKAARKDFLARRRSKPSDFLVQVLGTTPADRRDTLIRTFNDFITAAESAQREIEINRHFFTAALGAVEGTLQAVASSASHAKTYDRSGGRTGETMPIYVSTCT